MKNLKKIVWCMPLLGLLLSCTLSDGLLSDTQKDDIQRQMNYRTSLSEDIARKFEQTLSFAQNEAEKEALLFELAYMPIQDVADYEGEYIYTLTRQALQTRTDMPWGKTIPNDVFLHFVLPYRSNNEDVDSFRLVMYDQLKERITGMNMKDAALEINHWTHERVTYRGSNSRTLSPLNTVKTSWGRCGEESVLLTMALRTVGIPARQIYTPRWAHSDDNHAWVEMWVDGEWYFMGACEPAPDVNQGWFSEPARRAMLVSARTYGKYLGNEAVVKSIATNSYLNLTPNYAETNTLTVQIVSKDNMPVARAKVEFQVFNYGELSPIASLETDEKGYVSFVTGKGDLLLHASKGNLRGEKSVTVQNEDSVVVTLSVDATSDKNLTTEFTITPPATPEPLPGGKKNPQHQKRLKYNDSLRTAYMKTFATEDVAVELGQKLKLDEQKVWEILKRSAGNWQEMIDYLIEGSVIDKDITVRLALLLPSKDLQDGKKEILLDAVQWAVKNPCPADLPVEIYNEYVLNPRIGVEILSPYRSFLLAELSNEQVTTMQQSPEKIADFVRKNIKLIDEERTFALYTTPVGVYRLGVTDAVSLNSFFVAMCRTLGVPAQLDVTGTPFYYHAEKWHPVYFGSGAATEISTGQGYITLINNTEDADPEYRRQFTIGKWTDGRYKTLSLNAWEQGSQLKLSDLAKKPLSLEPGNYRIVTGKRAKDGSVPVKCYYFTVVAGETTEVPVSVRQNNDLPEPIAQLACITPLEDYQTGERNDFNPSEFPTGVVGVWLDPEKEPSRHILSEMKKIKPELEELNTPIGLLLNKSTLTEGFDMGKFDPLPKNATYFYDGDMKLLDCVGKSTNKSLVSYPIVVIMDKNGNIIYLQQGYKIGLAKEIYDIIKLFP